MNDIKMAEGEAAPVKMTRFHYELWWPIRVLLWLFGGVGDTSFNCGITIHPEKPIFISMTKSHGALAGIGYAGIAWNLATARQQANQILVLCDQFETFRQHAYGPPPKFEPGDGPA